MTLPTQTMENTTEVEYISIYDRRKGRPKGTCKFSDEERRERARLNSKKYCGMNTEKERERRILAYARKKENFLKM